MLECIVVERLLDDLNKEQRRAVLQTEGPLLIQAGAGSGKTKTLIHRIAYILQQNLAVPQQILAVTFTNKAAKEMRARIAKLLGGNPDSRTFLPYMGTFHGICVRFLRQDGEHIRIPKSFVIYDEADRLATIKRVAKKLMLDEKIYPPRTIANLISSAKNEAIDPVEYANLANSPTQQVAAEVYPGYQEALKGAGALDFDDLITRTLQLFTTVKEVRDKWSASFKYIMIDEYQDTNAAQYKLIKILVNENQNIAVVGDDWQSVYGWRGADFHNILNFEKDYKGTTVIKLEQNYRSTKPILEGAHSIITKNKKRSDKRLWTDKTSGKPIQIVAVSSERAEAETIVKRVRNSVDSGLRRFSDFAVLYRTNAQSRSIEEAFLHYSVPYRIVGGQRFYDRKEIKDIMSYLRFMYQPADRVSFERIVNVPARGIGKISLQRFYDWQESKGLTLLQALERVGEVDKLPIKALSGLRELLDIIFSAQQNIDDLAVVGIVDSLLKRIDYMTYLEDGSPAGDARQENVRELLSVAKQYNELGLSGFLEEISLVSDIDIANFSNNAVTLMTLHASKGLEFPVVFIAGMEETIFPHSRAMYDQSEMEEERRLCYVGMTRAKDELYMLHSVSRMLYGGTQHNPPSRFLSEISGDMVQEVSAGLSSSKSSLFSSEGDLTDWAGKIEDKGPISEEPRYVLEHKRGDKVIHELFGHGIIVDIDGDMLAIKFANGIKKFNSSFAPIKKL